MIQYPHSQSTSMTLDMLLSMYTNKPHTLDTNKPYTLDTNKPHTLDTNKPHTLATCTPINHSMYTVIHIPVPFTMLYTTEQHSYTLYLNPPVGYTEFSELDKDPVDEVEEGLLNGVDE